MINFAQKLSVLFLNTDRYLLWNKHHTGICKPMSGKWLSFSRKIKRRKNYESLPQCTGEPLVYQCVRFREELVVVCTPRGLITGKHRLTNCILSLFSFCFETYNKHVIVNVHPKWMFRNKKYHLICFHLSISNMHTCTLY